MTSRESPLMHELMAGALEASAVHWAREACRPYLARERRHALLTMVSAGKGGAGGHRFRARELLYDARGGMTAAQAERVDVST